METAERRTPRNVTFGFAAIAAALFGAVNYTGEGNAAAMASANFRGLGAVAGSRICLGNQRRRRKRQRWARSNGRRMR